MSRHPVEVDISNEKEWRRYQMKKLDSIDKRLSHLELTATTLKLKIGLFVTGGSMVISLVMTVMLKKLGLS
nr:hypothetical protein [uncultured bacterium]AMP48136.1 hypothetical protein [uncultured bacterium]